jgi:bifunctional UDP-N-acetylglucosamine pyrophosphorylase/glucosamine-1-phosphate N-acetyltransferase
MSQAIIMAAGEGKRMKSTLPKVLHTVLGDAMVTRILQKVIDIGIRTVYIVCSSNIDQIQDYVNSYLTKHDLINIVNVIYVRQLVPRGTGDAVKQCLPHLTDMSCNILILNGDTPLIDKTLEQFVSSPAPSLMVTSLTNPYGNGRIIKNESGQFMRIVEEKDATEDERKCNIVNCGVYFVPAHDLHMCIPKLSCNNAQSEYYLTDICEMLKDKLNLIHIDAKLQYELLNVNSKQDLAKAERFACIQTCTKKNMCIRPLVCEDYHKGYTSLLNELSNTIDAMSYDDFERIYNDMSQNPNHHIFVVEDEEQKRIVGNITLVVEPKFIHNGQKVGHIEDVVVASTHRTRKIGGLMVKYATSFMYDYGCYKMILDCVDKLETFYGRYGYEHKAIQMAYYV